VAINPELKKPFITIQPQPNEVTCGPTCLHAVYNYYGFEISLTNVISGVKQLKEGGTLGVLLGVHALQMGFEVQIYTYNLHMFDPTWFQNKTNIIEKLELQLKEKPSRKMEFATRAYQQFIRMGGVLKYRDLTVGLLKKFINRNIPILTGLSATYLYQTSREIGENNTYHDIKGFPAGHFVILGKYDQETQYIQVADPLNPNPINKDIQYYGVSPGRLVNAILLGIVTYDANLLIIQPKKNQ